VGELENDLGWWWRREEVIYTQSGSFLNWLMGYRYDRAVEGMMWIEILPRAGVLVLTFGLIQGACPDRTIAVVYEAKFLRGNQVRGTNRV
jgi:hypothetical protein